MCQNHQNRQVNGGMTKIKVEEAIGTRLAHDITEVRPGEFKGPSFKRGHKVEESDVCRLMRLGKRHLYILDLNADQVHEDDAVAELAAVLAGPGVTFSGSPNEGKLQLRAAYTGLLKINVEALEAFNLIPDVMCASMHNNVPVTKGQIVAGTRAIPLVIDRPVLDRAVALAREHSPIFSVKAYHRKKIRLIITGNEVYEGLIEDRFEAIVKDKLSAFGATLEETVILPDDVDQIADTVCRFAAGDTEMIITTGGMSVDPDDVTRHGIRKAGADSLYYGAAVLPGAMFQIAYKQDMPIVGIPACGLHHKTTVFDLVLPRLLAGERLDDRDLARFSVGGMCLECPVCRYPACPMGKAS
ncbi:molybdopterin-binding protein [Desulfosarcina ovata]|uniref:Molybdopterin molybdenumtransferase n=2 Tax=Desulfosarcina ovata TaxID=83564 RepID=A0A5K8ACN7_9BACT|nr:molybdopterin-binding protein [Desulfosarcina ovata]BBO83047.1 molybdopterin-binding protein [Desulfosarcina ovata subsp. sediminis]BBO90269.1 molybdopterin-binding protein [Desulfosarcina ovata subsp. ovata]